MNELIKYIQKAVNTSVVKSKLNQPYKKSKQHEKTLVYEKAFSFVATKKLRLPDEFQ